MARPEDPAPGHTHPVACPQLRRISINPKINKQEDLSMAAALQSRVRGSQKLSLD